MAITQEIVWTACDSLSHEGVAITAKSIRERIKKLKLNGAAGGSYSDITPHMSSWRKEHSGKEAPRVPMDLQNLAIKTIETIWDRASKEANGQFELAKHQANHDNRQLRQDIEDRDQTIADLEEEAKLQRKEMSTLKKELNSLKKLIGEQAHAADAENTEEAPAEPAAETPADQPAANNRSRSRQRNQSSDGDS